MPDDRTTDIKVEITSKYDPTGTDAAQTALRQTKTAAEEVGTGTKTDIATIGREAGKAAKEVKALSDIIQNAGKDGGQSTGKLSSMFGSLNKTLGGFLGKIGYVGLGYTLGKSIYEKFTEETRKLHAAQVEAIKKATEEAAKMKKQLEETVAQAKALSDLQYSQNKIATLTQAYRDHTAELQHQLEIDRKRAAIQAEMRGYKTQAERYELDNQLDRGEIGANEHRDKVRALEDRDREAKYAAEIGDVTKEMGNLREQARHAGEDLKTFQTDLDKLNKGEGIALSKVEEETLEARKTANDKRIATLDKEITDFERRGLQNTQSYREKINEYNWYDRDNAAIAARKKASKDWLAQDGHGGNYDNWQTLKNAADEKVQQANKDINDAVKAIQELNGTLDGINKTKTAEEEMVASNRANEDATTDTKDMRTMPVKQAVEQLTKEKTDLAEAAKLLEQSAKSDAAALADASAGVADAAKAAKGFGDVGLGKEVQDFMGGFEKMLKSSGELAGKGDKLATMSTTLQDLIKKGVFSPQQSNDLQEAMRVLISMAETQTAQKANADKTAELDKKIADLNSIETARRNIAEDTAAYERMADSLTRQAEEQAAKNEGDAAAQAALQTAIKTLADKTVTPDELPALLEAQESLNGATDAASVKTRELLNLIITGLGTAAGRLNKQSADLEANKTEVNRINAALAYPSK